ncbi:hypothetical protein AB0M12_18840 [Nocardia vinacea]|uniref:hypothetical protein n=1 Tax=Nocardia vinacea TaxID=96468 RepID=UPI0034417A80
MTEEIADVEITGTSVRSASLGSACAGTSTAAAATLAIAEVIARHQVLTDQRSDHARRINAEFPSSGRIPVPVRRSYESSSSVSITQSRRTIRAEQGFCEASVTGSADFCGI